jgi:hypothetical protein
LLTTIRVQPQAITATRECCSLPVSLCVARTEAEFLDEIRTKVLRVFLLAIHYHLYSFALIFLFLQTSVADPKHKFRIRIRHEGFGSRSETDQNFFFVLKFLPSLIFKHKKAAFPQLRDLATNKVRNKFAGFGSVLIVTIICLMKVHPAKRARAQVAGNASGLLFPLLRGTDPQIRIRTKKSWINNTAYNYL